MSNYYIAYGSNLNIEQMAYRCPNATVYGKGNIHNWNLAFHSMGGSAYATILQESGAYVPVVIWEIERSDEIALDIYEGFPHFYYKDYIEVELDSGKCLKGLVYIMNRHAKTGIPSTTYINTILEGYYDNQIEYDYLIKTLQRKKARH